MPDIFVNPHANNDDRTPEAKPVWERTAATTIEPVDEPTADVIAEPEERKPASVGPAVGMATSFCKNPTNISFNQQRTDEKILLFLRRDFITNIHWIISLIMALFVPPAVLFLLPFLHVPLPAFLHGFLAVFLIFYYLIIISFAFTNFASWFYNIGLITNKRIVDINLYNLAAIDVSATNLADVIDVEYTQQGMFEAFFNYGSVKAHIQATATEFVFEKVPRPTEVTSTLSDLIGGKNA